MASLTSSARRIADVDCEEEKENSSSSSGQQPDETHLRSIIKLSRSDEVDASLILHTRTRKRPRFDFKSQLDNRTPKQIRRDERIMRFVGTETRKGAHHNRKTITPEKKQTTWRLKKVEGLPVEDL